MKELLRRDEFRCHDPHLVRVLPGKECEAAEFAEELRRAGHPVGLFVQGDDVVEWAFLKKATAIERFEFVDFSDSLSDADLSPLRDARFLRVVGRKMAIDFAGFERLEVLHYQWSGGATGLELASQLREAYLYEIRASANASPLPLGSNVRKLHLFNFWHPSLEFRSTMSDLDELAIERARKLTGLPALDGLTKIEMKNTGAETFDYSSLPSGIKDVEIDACAPITSWEFVWRAKLKRLVVWNNKVPPTDQETQVALDQIEAVDFYRNTILQAQAQ